MSVDGNDTRQIVGTFMK